MKNKFLRYTIKSILILFAIVILLITIASTYIYFNKEEIYQEIITSLNDNQVGKTYIDDIEIAPFSAFPYISIDLKNVRFFSHKNYNENEKPIYAFEDVYVGFDLIDLLRGNFNIRKIIVKNGHLRLEKYEDGTINLLLAKDSGTTSDEDEDSAFALNLEDISLENILFENVDYQNFNYLSVLIEDAKSKFSIGEEQMKIHVDIDMFLNEYNTSGTPVFENKYFELHNDVIYTNETEFLEILPGDFILENGRLDFEGSIDFKNDVNLDINISGRKRNFETFLYFAPDEIFNKLKQFKNEGDIYLIGKISGPVLNEPPAIYVELGCENTFFFHEDEEEAIRDLSFKGVFTTGEENTLRTAELYFENFSGLPGKGEFKGAFRVKNFLDPIFEVDFHADLDLSDIKAFYDVPGLNESRGNLTIDLKFFEYMDVDSAIRVASELDDNSNSRIRFKDAYLDWEDYPHPLERINGTIEFMGDDIKLNNLEVHVGSNDIDFSLEATNISAFVHNMDKTIDLVTRGKSNRLSIAELVPKKYANDTIPFFNDVITNFSFDFDFHANSKSLKEYNAVPDLDLFFRELKLESEKYPHALTEFSGKISASDDEIALDQLKIMVGSNDLFLSGHILNPDALMSEKVQEKVYYDLTVQSKKTDLKELLVYDGKPLIDESLDEEIEQELIQNLHFTGKGFFISNSFCPNGFLSQTEIERFNIKYNELPYLEKVSGKVVTDTSGCITINEFTASIGRSDLHLNLKMEHFLDSNLVNKKILGSFKSNMLDFDELLSYQEPAPSEEVDHDDAFNVFLLPFPNMELGIEIKELRHHKYLVRNIQGTLRSNEDHYVYFDDFSLLAADGKIDFDGYLNGSNHDSIYFSSTLKLDDIDLDQVFYKFDNFGQDYMINDNVHGRLDGTIQSMVRMHTDFTPYLDKTDAHIEVKMREGMIENFTPLLAMSDFMGNKNLNRVRFAELENTLDFKDGVLSIPDMQIASTLGYIHLNGTHSLDMDMDYEIKVPLSLIKSSSWNMMKSKLRVGKNRKKATQELEDEIIKEQKGLVKGYTTFTIQGNIDDYKVGVGKRKEGK